MEQVKKSKRLCRSVYRNQVNGEKSLVERSIERIKSKLKKGVAINPCAYNEHDLGRLIIECNNHISFVNFPNLMNDEKFVLEVAQKSVNPVLCEDYFYQFINENLKRKSDFKCKFLKAVLLNDNVYKVEDVQKIVEDLKLQKIFDQLMNDVDFKKQVMLRLVELQNHEFAKYSCSGTNSQELRSYKVTHNKEVVLLQNKIAGVKEILKMFKCRTDEEEREKAEKLAAAARNFGLSATGLAF